jgi:hypothetical protein
LPHCDADPVHVGLSTGARREGHQPPVNHAPHRPSTTGSARPDYRTGTIDESHSSRAGIATTDHTQGQVHHAQRIRTSSACPSRGHTASR